MSESDEMCECCGENPATAPHTCPYKEEINYSEDLCTCCDDCRWQCDMEI